MPGSSGRGCLYRDHGRAGARLDQTREMARGEQAGEAGPDFGGSSAGLCDMMDACHYLPALQRLPEIDKWFEHSIFLHKGKAFAEWHVQPTRRMHLDRTRNDAAMAQHVQHAAPRYPHRLGARGSAATERGREKFQQFRDHASPTWSGKCIDQWCTQAVRSRMEPIKIFARSGRTHRELLLNYFRAREEFSSRIIEGLNNKAKITMRKAYGYRSFRISQFHVLGKRPEPKLARDFY